mmetsp:Transcript_2491/g.7890  ORF Transcript_2491/g.7890 Transcript_2491/m.7890 type:complete len:121 (+) Transcript_2491:627-989(+)
MRDQLLGSKPKIVSAQVRLLTSSHLVIDVSGVFFRVFKKLSEECRHFTIKMLRRRLRLGHSGETAGEEAPVDIHVEDCEWDAHKRRLDKLIKAAAINIFHACRAYLGAPVFLLYFRDLSC